jgi:hypothetical protein
MIKLMDIMEGKFDPHKAKSLTFVTYGGLSATKQLGYKKSDTFHSPPAPKGIYAFVWPYIEYFLLGGEDYVNPKLRGKRQRQRMSYVKDKDGNPITTDHPEYDKYSARNKNWSMRTSSDDEDYKGVLYRNANRKKFKYDGPIWHHLEVPEWTVLARRKEWVKTDMNAFIAAFRKELINIKRHNYSKDHLEVFIEDKI